MPVRRLHNFVYRPRLFYLQWVEGVFVPNEDTVMGSAVHGRVDEPSKLRDELLADSGGTLRSVTLSSERLGLTGIADLVEQDADGQRRLGDYKKGSPLRGQDGEWVVKPNDAVQIAAYVELLKEQGVSVDSASVYYAEIKKHVAVQLSPDLKDSMFTALQEARALADSGRCPKKTRLTII